MGQLEAGTSATHSLLCIEEDTQSRGMNKTIKKKNPTKKRKVNSEQEVTVGPQESLQQMEKLSSRPLTLDGYYGTQQIVPGMVQLNLMAPTRNNYYANQQTIQGLGQLNSIVSSHEQYPTKGKWISSERLLVRHGIRHDDTNVRRAQLHDDASTHA